LRWHHAFLIRATRHDLQRLVRQWPLRGVRFVSRRAHPAIPFSSVNWNTMPVPGYGISLMPLTKGWQLKAALLLVLRVKLGLFGSSSAIRDAMPSSIC
jgi:hypothetical protein